MTTMNVSLPEKMKDWVEAQAETGRYANASDYVRDLIRRDQERAGRIGAMQKLITEGIESGEPQPFDTAEFLAEARRRYAGETRGGGRKTKARSGSAAKSKGQ